MPDGQAVDGLAVGLPLGHELVHERDEAGVVGRLQQVREFVDDDIFETLAGFLGEVGVEADAVGVRIAPTPLGFHALHEDAADHDAHLPAKARRAGGVEEVAAAPGVRRPIVTA